MIPANRMKRFSAVLRAIVAVIWSMLPSSDRLRQCVRQCRGEMTCPNSHYTETPLRLSWLYPRPRHCRTHRSEEHTSELQSLMRISYAVFCLKQKNYN